MLTNNAILLLFEAFFRDKILKLFSFTFPYSIIVKDFFYYKFNIQFFQS